MIQIESEENVPLLKVIFEQGEMAGRTLVSKMLSCTEVTCTCGSIHLDFGKDEDGSALWLDTYEKQVETLGEDERLTPLAEYLSGELREEDWDKLYQTYYAFKVIDTETLEPGTTNAVFDEKLAEKGVLISYNKVLPYRLTVPFTLDDVKYDLDTSYCLRSGCRCNTADLVFIAKKEGEELTGVEFPQINYDYRTGQYTVEEPGKNLPHTPVELVDSLRQKLPELPAFLKNRHDKFRKIYKGYLKREGIPPGPQPVAIQPGEAGLKVGHNEPCPCISGKKV